ncbi:DUF7674 family protein [Asticcacaulis solisilvae]|uniref:DUF7674 family protein n=1 Tax=Asticcacaulis solisilvae TaxID=1217274 RepID=UPI003FD8DECA
MSREASQGLCKRVAQICPELSELFQEHVDYHEEILPHVFFGDVTRFVEECVKSDKDQDHQALRKLVEVIEQGLSEHDPDVDNLIYVSFIENVPEMSDILPIAGPKLSAAIRKFGMI